MAVEDLTPAELHAIAQRIKDSVARYRKARGEPDPAPVNPDNPPEIKGVPAPSE